MSTEYFEINSTYRNRNQFPSPADFDIEISQTGTRNNIQALDPVSFMAPRKIFVPFPTITGTIANPTSPPYLPFTTSREDLILEILSGTASTVLNYYEGIVLIVTTSLVPLTTEWSRILTWRYIQTIGGFDYFKVTVELIFSNNINYGNTITMSDPTELPIVGPSLNRFGVFIPRGILSNNYYIEYYIYNQTRNEWLPIDYYDGDTRIAIVYIPTIPNDRNKTFRYTNSWLRTDILTLRLEPPREVNNVVNVSANQKFITLSATSSSIDNFYVGSFLRIQTLPLGLTDESHRIVSYNGTTKQVTLEKIFSIPVVIGDTYEILLFNRDNVFPFVYSGSIVSLREAVCYDVQLLNLILPNIVLNVGSGSRAVYYPYVYVQLAQLNNSERQGPNSITSNNPNSRRMLFRALVNDTTNDTNSPFVRIDGGGMVQRIKLLPTDSFHFSVHLPNGEVFSTDYPEYYQPDVPNNLKQISALFSFKRVPSI